MNECSCSQGPLTREEVLDFTFSILGEAVDLAADGREVEAQVVNQIAQTALALVERVMPAPAGLIH